MNVLVLVGVFEVFVGKVVEVFWVGWWFDVE